MKPSDKPVANPDIVFREEFDDWAILFDPDTGDAHGMNPVSAFIWKHLTGKNSIEDISKKLKALCKDAPDEIQSHVFSFVSQLTEKGYAGFEINIS